MAILLIGLGVILSSLNGVGREPRSTKIALLSSIPLQWGEGDLKSVVEGDGKPDPLFERLSEMRDVVAVDNFEQVQASGTKVALLILHRCRLVTRKDRCSPRCILHYSRIGVSSLFYRSMPITHKV